MSKLKIVAMAAGLILSAIWLVAVAYALATGPSLTIFGYAI